MAAEVVKPPCRLAISLWESTLHKYIACSSHLLPHSVVPLLSTSSSSYGSSWVIVWVLEDAPKGACVLDSGPKNRHSYHGTVVVRIHMRGCRHAVAVRQ